MFLFRKGYCRGYLLNVRCICLYSDNEHFFIFVTALCVFTAALFPLASTVHYYWLMVMKYEHEQSPLRLGTSWLPRRYQVGMEVWCITTVVFHMSHATIYWTWLRLLGDHGRGGTWVNRKLAFHCPVFQMYQHFSWELWHSCTACSLNWLRTDTYGEYPVSQLVFKIESLICQVHRGHLLWTLLLFSS